MFELALRVLLLAASMSKRAAALTTPTKGSAPKRAKSAAAKVADKKVLSCGPLLGADEPLFLLGEAHGLVRCKVLRRPSSRNRSPYVCDVELEDGREALCHVPSLGLAGKADAGAFVLVKPAVDKKGELVGDGAVSPKYGTPKCEFICQLAELAGGGYVGAHPSIGETAAKALLLRTKLLGDLWAGGRDAATIRREVTNPFGADMRSDFVVSGGEDAEDLVLEVKTVVDCDTDAGFEAGGAGPRVAAIFPWGTSNQKGPDGEKVVSARAIKHVDGLAKIKASGDAAAAVLFVAVRQDCDVFRPNVGACPSFAAHVAAAADAGVAVVARRLRWDVRGGVAAAFDDGPIDVVFP